MPGTAGAADVPPTKTVIVYRNGDAFFPGRKVVVNPRQVSTYDNLLTYFTGVIEAPFGAVRKLYTPTEGHKVQHMDDLKHGSAYVAAGNEQFKKLDYSEITHKKPQNKEKEPILPVVHSRLVVSARWRRTSDESCTINVFTNGDVLVPPARIRIPKYTLRSWENVLAMVTKRVCLRTGAVYRLCRLDGRPVCGPTELQNNQHYVAVGAEKFKALPYEHCIPCRDSIRENKMFEGQDTLPAIRKTRHAKDGRRRRSISAPLNGTSGLEQPLKSKLTALQSIMLKLSSTMFPSEARIYAEFGVHRHNEFAHTRFRENLEHAARGQMQKPAAKLERTKQQRQVSRNPVLFSTGEGSVFNAQNKRSEVAGAAEVQEERQLKVDLPIDQVEAKIVDEEYEDRSCCASPCKASLHDSDGLYLQRSLSAGSGKDEAKEREVSSRLCRIRSRMSWFFKEKIQP